MLELHPCRRDPRLLLLDLGHAPVTWACVDAFEVRGLGVLPRFARRAALVRLLLELRPSHVTFVSGGVSHTRATWRALVEARGIAVVDLDLAARRRALRDTPTIPQLRESYPELRHLAATPHRRALHTLRLAVAVLLHHPLHPRRYVPGLALRPAPRLDR